MSECKDCNFFCDGVDKAPQRSLFNALGMTKGRNEKSLWLVSFLLITRSFRDI